MSSFDRWYVNSGPGVSKRDAEKQLITLFKEEASRLTPDPLPENDQEKLLGLAQHYGLPTRLLDWTESPYVAAFFAFSGIAAAPDAISTVAIWSLNTTHQVCRDETGISLVNVLSPYNERLKNQLGKFTRLRRPFDTLEEHLDQADKSGTALTKVMLPAREAWKALADLDFMGINYSTIYPGTYVQC